MIFIRIVEFLSVYIILKAWWELYMNNKAIDSRKGVYGSIVHSYQHMAALIGIIFYNCYDLFSYIWFEGFMEYGNSDFSVLFFNILFLNIVWLIVIDHFKQERLEKSEPINFIDIFKF